MSLMRRLFIFSLLFFLCGISSMAVVWHSVNIDKATIAAMGAAYTKEGVVERNTETLMDSIFRHYTKASASTAGIYAAWKRDHDAMKNVKFFDPAEFFYYKRAYSLVKDGIMPKMINVTYMFVQEPDQILTWGPYLFRTTNRVENLCKEFETIVTNGRCSFRDLVFLTVNGRFSKYFDLLQRAKDVADIDYKALLEEFGEFGKDLSWKDVQEDVEKFVKNLATVGKNTSLSVWDDASQIGQVFKANPGEIIKMFNHYKSMYNQFKDASNVKQLLKQVVDTHNPNWLSQIFDVSDYNITNYMSSYIEELQGTYYTQMYYIRKVTRGQNVLLDFVPRDGTPKEVYSGSGKPEKVGTPPKGWDDWLVNGPVEHNGKGSATSVDDWKNGEDHLPLNRSSLQSKVQGITGWTNSRKQQFELANPGHSISYEYSYYHQDRVNYKGHYGNHNRFDNYCFRAAGQRVTDTWEVDTILYSEMFDSQTMDLTSFKQKLERLKQGYEENMLDEKDPEYANRANISYEITTDDRRFYTVSDQQKVSGAASATFLANCKNSQSLGDGSFQWKENSKQQKGEITEYSERLAMMTKGESSTPEDLDALTSREAELKQEIKDLEKQEEDLDAQCRALQQKIQQAQFNGDYQTAAMYRQQWYAYDAQLNSTKAAKQAATDELNEVQGNIQAYYDDMLDDSDADYNRIPKYMNMYASVYGIRWNDGGSWDSNHVYTCLGYSNIGGFPVKFTAKLTLARKPQYFLGVRIHRPILQVEYSLTSDNAAQTVIESMNLDPKADPKDNEEKVNKRLRELLLDYPDCDITIDYQKSAEVDAEEDEDGIHLLYASDRLEIAREVVDQLVSIYSELVLLEKNLHYRKGIKDFFKAILGDLKNGAERGDLAKAAFYEWRNASLRAMEKQSPLYKDPQGDDSSSTEEGSGG